MDGRRGDARRFAPGATSAARSVGNWRQNFGGRFTHEPMGEVSSRCNFILEISDFKLCLRCTAARLPARVRQGFRRRPLGYGGQDTALPCRGAMVEGWRVEDGTEWGG